MKLLPFLAMAIGVAIGVFTGHIMWGFWGGLIAALATLAIMKRPSRLKGD